MVQACSFDCACETSGSCDYGACTPSGCTGRSCACESLQVNVKQLNGDCRSLDTAIGIIFDSCRGDCESLLSFMYDFLLAACIWLSAVVGRCPKKTRSLIFTGLSAGTTNPKRIALPGVRRNAVPFRPPRSCFLLVTPRPHCPPCMLHCYRSSKHRSWSRMMRDQARKRRQV